MSLKASVLRKSHVQDRQIDENVRQILKSLDDEIKTVHNEGKKRMITTLPIVFDIQNMTNQEAQKSIWARVIMDLIDRGFRVSIRPTSKECRIKITWLTKDDEIREQYENQVLLKHIDPNL